MFFAKMALLFGSIGIISFFAALFFFATGEMFQWEMGEQAMYVALIVGGVCAAIIGLMSLIQWLSDKFTSSGT